VLSGQSSLNIYGPAVWLLAILTISKCEEGLAGGWVKENRPVQPADGGAASASLMSLLVYRHINAWWKKFAFSEGWFTWLCEEHVWGSELPVSEHETVETERRLWSRATIWWLAWMYNQTANGCLVSATWIHPARDLHDGHRRWNISKRHRTSLQIITTMLRK
jgi:hypothetical protein